MDIGKEMEKIEKAAENLELRGIITDVREGSNVEVYKEGTIDERMGYILTIQVKDYPDTTFTTFLSKPSILGFENSKLYKFKKHYGSYPEKDMEVELKIEDNFLRLVV